MSEWRTIQRASLTHSYLERADECVWVMENLEMRPFVRVQRPIARDQALQNYAGEQSNRAAKEALSSIVDQHKSYARSFKLSGK